MQQLHVIENVCRIGKPIEMTGRLMAHDENYFEEESEESETCLMPKRNSRGGVSVGTFAVFWLEVLR